MRKRSISLRALIVGLASSAPGAAFAFTGCPNVVPPEHAFAGPWQNCTAPPGAYNPVATGASILPFNDPGYGFVSYGGGQLTAGAVTITPPNATGADAVLSTGAGSLVTLTAGATLTTSGVNANAVQADSGGKVAIGAVGVTTTVSTSGNFGYALYATGANSQIDATNVAASVAYVGGPAVSADLSAKLNVTGGSVSTNGRFAVNVQAINSSTITVTGATLSATGAGAEALFSSNGGRIDASNVTITSTGRADSVTGAAAGAASNNGGLLNISKSILSASGVSGYGVYTAGGGVTTLTGAKISVTGANGYGLQANSGGSIAVTGGSVNVSGTASLGFLASGIGSNLAATNVALTATGDYGGVVGAYSDASISLKNGSVTTSGVDSTALSVGSGMMSATETVITGSGTMTASGTVITTNGAGSGGVFVNGATGSFTGSNLTFLIKGAYDATNKFAPTGLANIAEPDFPTGGILNLSNSVVSVEAAKGAGSYTSGGGVTTLNGDTITVSGANAGGVVSDTGGATTVTGGAVTATGLDANGLNAFAGGAITASGVSVTTTANGASGVAVAGPSSTFAGSNLNILVQGGYDSTSGFHANGVTNQSFGSAVGGGTVTLINSQIAMTGDYGEGVYNGNGGSVKITGGSITTAGVQSDGVYTTGASTTNLNGVRIATSGNGSAGLYATGANSVINATDVVVSTSGANFANPVVADNGGAVTMKGGSLSTSGNDYFAAFVGNQATISLTGTTITTTGLGSGGVAESGANASFTGDKLVINVKGGFDPSNGNIGFGVINQAFQNYSGGGAVNLTNSTITVAGQYGAGALNASAGVMTITGGSIATSGLAADGVDTQGGASTTLSGVRIATTGDGSKGLAVYGATSALNGANLTISTSGTTDSAGNHAQALYNGAGGGATSGGTVTLTASNLSTSGDQAPGVLTQNGGSTTLTGGSVITAGVHSAAALGLYVGALTLNGVTLTTTGAGSTGLALNGSGGTVTASGLTITTSGGVDAASTSHADGVYNGAFGNYAGGGTMKVTDSSVKTSGYQANGVGVGAGGVTTFLGGAIATSGTGALAAFAKDGGALTIGLDASGAGAAIATSGDAAYAVGAANGGLISLTGATVTTTGAGSGGFGVNGGGEIDASNVTIATQGGLDAASGKRAYGVYNGSDSSYANGGVVKLSDVAVKTAGAGMYGVIANAGGVTTALGGSVATSGAAANAVLAQSGGSIAVGLDAGGKGAALSTSGAGAYGVIAAGGGLVSLDGASIATTGDGSGGLGVNGAGSEIDATNVTISTQGGLDAASGLHAYGAVNTPYGSYAAGGTLKLSNVAIATAGQGMIGVYAGASSTTIYNGGSVTTTGVGAHGLDVNGAGANLTASGVTVSTSGAGAYGAYVANGGALTLGQGVQLSATGANSGALFLDSGATATVNGQVAFNGASSGVVVGQGALTVNGALTIRAAGVGLENSGLVNAPGALSITTTAAPGSAITMFGNGAAFSGTGGGVIDAADAALTFLDGPNGQSATFTNYAIQSGGDLIYLDPSSATVNFNNSTANAGAGNLIDAASGALTVNANASLLTGAAKTAAGAVSTLNLSNGSNWTISGNSTLTNLSLNNASAGFSAPGTGGFKTLTVTNYTGNGASLTLNAMLTGAGQGADQIIVNGGQATGSTKIVINPLTASAARFAALPGAASSGLPIVVAANGATIAPGAFTLAGPVMAGGYIYSLQSQSGGDFLVANQGLTGAQASGSLASLAQSRQSQAITSRVLTSILTGATEQINCSSCSSGFASFGSFAIGAHGRWSLSPSLALLAGASYDSYSAQGVTVNNSLEAAIGLRYDMVQLGRYRPFFEAGVAVSPYANISFSRSYASNVGGGTGVGDTLSRSASVYGRSGYIWRLTPRDEAAAYASFTRSWQSTGGYLEGATAGNPFGALVLPSLDAMNIAEGGAQYTHLFGQHIEANVSVGYAVAFDANYGSQAAISGFGPASGVAPTSFSWAELGGRLSYRFSKTVIGDAFVLGTVGAEPAGNQMHGGVALRMEF